MQQVPPVISVDLSQQDLELLCNVLDRSSKLIALKARTDYQSNRICSETVQQMMQQCEQYDALTHWLNFMRLKLIKDSP